MKHISKKTVYGISIALCILSVIAVIISLSAISMTAPSETAPEKAYYVMNSRHIALIFATIPILFAIVALVIMLRGKRAMALCVTASISAGILLSIFFTLGINEKTYSTDTRPLERVREVFGVEIPKDVTILTKDLESNGRLYDGGILYKSETVVRFNDENELSAYYEAAKLDKCWTESIWIYYAMVPRLFHIRSYPEYDLNMFYCFETGEYNKRILDPGSTCVYVGLDVEDGVMYILEFESVNYRFREGG